MSIEERNRIVTLERRVEALEATVTKLLERELQAYETQLQGHQAAKTLKLEKKSA